MAKGLEKSVITCDMEGRIDTFGDGSEAMFGYSKEEIVGRKRVSLFSPGRVVLEHVPAWLEKASIEGEHVAKTVFLRKDGTPFAAEIRITPTFKDGVQNGFCGVTEALTDVKPEEVAPKISTMTNILSWLVVTRAPFLTAMIIPMLIGAAWVAANNMVASFPWGTFFTALFAGIFMHVAANTFNDYFDWRSGTDPNNNDYFLPYTGGSRSLELGLINERSLLILAIASLLISSGLGYLLYQSVGIQILYFGLLGAFFAFFYTAPPLRLAARRGLGELVVGLSFGPLATAGTVLALTGSVNTADFLVGVPIGLLTTAILWINEFPDIESDLATGKANLVATLGRERARYGYVALMILAFGLAAYWTLVDGTYPIGALLILGAAPMAYRTSKILMNEYAERSLVRANATTINLQMVGGVLMVIGLVLSSSISNLLGL